MRGEALGQWQGTSELSASAARPSALLHVPCMGHQRDSYWTASYIYLGDSVAFLALDERLNRYRMFRVRGGAAGADRVRSGRAQAAAEATKRPSCRKLHSDATGSSTRVPNRDDYQFTAAERASLQRGRDGQEVGR